MKFLLVKLAVIMSILAPALALPPLALSVAAQGDDKLFAACDDPNIKVKPTICNERGQTENPAIKLIRNIVNIVTVIAGIAAVVVIMLAGFSFITSAGNAEKVAKARAMLLYAVIGLLIIILAQAIVRFVLSTTG